MAKGERQQASGKQARKAAPVNDNKPRRAVSGEAQFRKPATAAGTANASMSSKSAGARQGNPRSSGAKPSGTNVSKGGGTSAKGSK